MKSLLRERLFPLQPYIRTGSRQREASDYLFGLDPPRTHTAGSPTVGTPQGSGAGPVTCSGEGVATGGQPVTTVGMVGLIRRGQRHSGPVIEGTRDPLLLRLPLPRQLFGLGYLGRGHPLGNNVEVLDRSIKVLAGG